jgi:hypothetical protein
LFPRKNLVFLKVVICMIGVRISVIVDRSSLSLEGLFSVVSQTLELCPPATFLEAKYRLSSAAFQLPY